MTAAVDLSVVVPTYRRPASLRAVLTRLGELAPAPVEVIVVAGDDESATVAAEFPVRVLRVDNRNAASSRNQGWHLATATAVGFLDDDCTPASSWADVAVAALDQPTVAAAGGHVHNPRPDRLLARVAQQWLGRRYEPGPADWLATQNLVVRRTVLEQIGGFDESLVSYEDVDFSLRARATGGVLVRVPAMEVGHEHRLRLAELWRQHAGYGHGFVQLARKHSDWDQARRAPLTPVSAMRALALALVRPFRCAAGMATPADAVRSFPVFVLRELAFLSGAVAEARR